MPVMDGDCLSDTESEMSRWGQYDLTREFVSSNLVKPRDHYSVEWDAATAGSGLKHLAP